VSISYNDGLTFKLSEIEEVAFCLKCLAPKNTIKRAHLMISRINQIFNYLTPWSRVVLQKETVSQLLNKFSLFYVTRGFRDSEDNVTHY
jgi:hypothetical protein